MSQIEWTNETWNPIVGCSKVSPGCTNCYAIKEAHRLAGNPNPKINSVYGGLTERRGDRTEWTGVTRFVPERLEQPLKWRKPRMVFVNSMSDLFHESVVDEQLDEIFAVMALTPQHTYQVLTKRPERMLEYFSDLATRTIRVINSFSKWVGVGKPYEGKGLTTHLGGRYDFWPFPNIWLGVTAENQQAANNRIPLLLQTPAAIRFLSCEPLLDPVCLTDLEWGDPGQRGGQLCFNGLEVDGDPRDDEDFHGATIDWVIVGGESGHSARPCNIDWIRSIVRQCHRASVPVFVKQFGSRPIVPDYSKGFALSITGKGGDIEQWPADLRVREFPIVA